MNGMTRLMVVLKAWTVTLWPGADGLLALDLDLGGEHVQVAELALLRAALVPGLADDLAGRCGCRLLRAGRDQERQDAQDRRQFLSHHHPPAWGEKSVLSFPC